MMLSELKNSIQSKNKYKKPFNPEGIWFKPSSLNVASNYSEYLVKSGKEITPGRLRLKILVPPEVFKLDADFSENCREITNLRDNWDDEGALKPDINNVKDILEFYSKYGTLLLDKFGVNLDVPEINPGRDGSIDLVWRGSKNFMLINFRKPSERIAYFYFDEYDQKLGKQGGFKLDVIDDVVLSFLKQLE